MPRFASFASQWRDGFGLLLVFAGCAASPSMKVSSGPLPSPASAPVVSSPRRVSLPYQFVRSGVELQAVAVEFEHGPEPRLLVTFTYKATRPQAVKLMLKDLATAESAGQTLPLKSLVRGDQPEAVTQIDIPANARGNFMLAYALPPNPDTVIVRFPTGKWWQSGS